MEDDLIFDRIKYVVLLTAGIFSGLIIILAGGFWYIANRKYTDIDTQVSPDGRCQLTLQMRGETEWPFGSTYGRIVGRYDDKIINKPEFEIYDDGSMLQEENGTGTGIGIEKAYTPVIFLHSSSSEEKEWFCSDVTNWLLYVMKELPYEENEELYQMIINVKEDTEEETEKTELTEETIKYYLSLQPDCSYKTSDGVEYRMIPVDRACGSSYYALIATADGGRVFETVEYPSAKVKLSDGTYYNPFVMPERVYEKDGKLYMEAGQGADGDYYGEEGFCNGLYESEDNGKTWTYVREIAVRNK